MLHMVSSNTMIQSTMIMAVSEAVRTWFVWFWCVLYKKKTAANVLLESLKFC